MKWIMSVPDILLVSRRGLGNTPKMLNINEVKLIYITSASRILIVSFERLLKAINSYVSYQLYCMLTVC